MKQEIWITIRLKGEVNADEDANATARHVLHQCQHLFMAGHPGMSFTICQPGDVIEVEEEAQIYDTERA